MLLNKLELLQLDSAVKVSLHYVSTFFLQGSETHSLIYASPNRPGILSVVDHWQTLVGAFAGAIIAIIGSMIIYRLQEQDREKKEWKEALRRIEIRLTMSLEDAFTARRQLRETAASIRKLINDVKTTPPGSFAIHVTNMPLTGQLYRDEKLAELKVKSNYLHNKLIIVDKILKEVNSIIDNVKKDFEDLIQRNQFIITLEAGRPNPIPANQRDAYVDDLEGFLSTLEIY